jgi:hypothetical protein
MFPISQTDLKTKANEAMPYNTVSTAPKTLISKLKTNIETDRE